MTQTTTKPTLKQIWVTMLCASILLASAGFAMYEGVNPNIVNDALQNQISNLQNLAILENQSIAELNATLIQNLDAAFYALQKPCSYILSITHDGAYYTMQNGTTGGLDYFGNNATALETNADGNLTQSSPQGNLIWVRDGYYNITTNGWYLHKYNMLIGENSFNTVLNVTGNINAAITIDPTVQAATWQIENLKVLLNNFNGYGIYSTHATVNSIRTKVDVENVGIEGIASGYYGTYLIDAGQMYWNTVRVSSAGGCVYFGTDNTGGNFGNSIFDFLDMNPLANNAVGLTIVGSSTDAMNLAEFHRLQFIPAVSFWNGTLAINITSERLISFYDSDIESASSVINLTSCHQIGFYGQTFVSATNTTYQTFNNGITLYGTTYACQFIGGQWTTFSQYMYNDQSTSNSPIHNFLDGGGYWASFGTGQIQNFGAETDLGYVFVWNPSSGAYCPTTHTSNTANCVNGTWIAHGIFGAPTWVGVNINPTPALLALGGINVYWIGNNANTTQFQILMYWANGTAVDANHSPQTVYWTAQDKVTT